VGTPAQRLESERAKYPAMQVDEILVWRNFLRDHELEYNLLTPEWIRRRSTDVGARPQLGDRFDYNLRLGVDVDPGPSFPDNIRAAAIASRSLRVDAVGFQDGAPVLFEVKRRAGPQNVGQLLVYRDLWQTVYADTPAPRLALVFSELNSHILPTAKASAIELVQQPTDFSFLSPLSVGRPLP
jgi:hypothetical protein